MPDDELTLENKDSGMSFNDWKKMKNALNESVDNTAPKQDPKPKKDPPPSKQPVTKTKVNKNNTKNQFNKNNYSEFRKPPSILNFESLMRNNQLNFGGNMGLGYNMPYTQNPFLYCPPAPHIPPHMPPHMMNFNQQRINPRSDFIDFRQDSTSFMHGHNNFIMPRRNIPQQPFPMYNISNEKRMNNSVRPTNNQTLSNSRPQQKSVTNNKVATKKTTEPKVVKDTTTTPTTSKPVETEQASSNDTQTTPKPKKKKQKRKAKTPQPPTTPESSELAPQTPTSN